MPVRGTPTTMRLTAVVVLWCACAATADFTRIKSGKAALLRKLVGRHNKRGVLGSVPTYKVGHDIPYVTHSVLKPLVVTYPPTAVPYSVKVPITNPIAVRYPIGHKPHTHFHKKFLFGNPPRPHVHHHHHIAPKPIVPVAPPPTIVPAATPAVPVASVPVTPLIPQASVHVPQPIPLPQPPPPVLLPTPSNNFIPHQSVHLRPTALPILPTAPAAFQPTPAQLYPIAPQYPYVIRPGGAVQTSVFATYPKYPVVNFAPPLIPSYDQLYLERPQVQVPVPQVPAPHYHLVPQPTATPALLQPAHTPLPVNQEAWSPLPLQHPEPTPQFAHEHGAQSYEEHGGQFYHDHIQHQLQDQAHHQYHELEHVQHQIQELEQAQLEQQFNNQQQLNQEYGQPQQEYSQPNQEYPQQEYAQANQEYPQHEYGQPNQEYHLPPEYSQHQVQQEYGPPDRQPNSEYGPPGFEGRSGEDDGQQEQAYHNHIPLGLQPPIDRPLEHFR